MPADSANSSSGNPRDARRGRSRQPVQEESVQGLESFSIEVSAARKLSGGNPGEAIPGSQPSDGATVPVQPQPQRATGRRRLSAQRASGQRVRFDLGDRTGLPRRGRRKQVPSWLVSLVVHVFLIVTLGLLTFSTFDERFDFTLSLESDAWAEDEVSFEEVELGTLDSLASLETFVDSELLESDQLLGDLSVDDVLGDTITESHSSLGASAGTSALLGPLATRLSDVLPDDQSLTASFFGTKVEGKRIVYVLDNSGGMRGGELEALVDELMQSVGSLAPHQRFYVIFYSDRLYPLFYPRYVERFVPADDRSRERLQSWLKTVEFCLGNEVDQAIQAAASIHPDVVYLLTDGDLDGTRDQRRMAVLLDNRSRRFPIHTFGMGTGEHSKAADKLRQVAEANRGTFRAVKVSAKFKERAEELNRPYHNKEPGKVWGLNVGRGWGR